jgi:hypothetical protein
MRQQAGPQGKKAEAAARGTLSRGKSGGRCRSGARLSRDKQLRDLDDVLCLAWSPDGRLLAVGAETGILDLYDARTLWLRSRVQAHKGPVYCMSWSHRGDRIASGGAFGEVQIWRAPSLARLRRLQDLKTGVRTVGWSVGDQYLAAAAIPNSWSAYQVWVWDGRTGKPRAKFLGEMALAWKPGALELAMRSLDRTIEVRRVPDGQVRSVLPAAGGHGRSDLAGLAAGRPASCGGWRRGPRLFGAGRPAASEPGEARAGCKRGTGGPLESAAAPAGSGALGWP